MNRKHGIIALLTVLLAGEIAQGGILRGSVRTAEGDPLVARITVLRGPVDAGLTTYDTDSDGTFSIELNPAGLIAAAATARGYASHEIDLSTGLPSGSVRFTLHELQLVEGRITDSHGNVVAGARVGVRELSATRRIYLDDYMEGITDAAGEFVLAVTRGPGRFVVDVEAAGWVPQSSGVLGSGSVASTGGTGGSQSVLVSLQSRGAKVDGRVTSSSGAGLSGITVLASVRVSPARTDDGAEPGQITGPGTGPIRPYGKTYRVRTTTDSAGYYSFSGVPSGSLGIAAVKRGVRASPQWFPLSDGGSVTANFVLPE